MQNNGRSGGTCVRYRCHKFYRSGAGCFRQFTVLSTNHLPSHLHLHQLHNLQDCKLILQNKEDYKSPEVQRVQLKTLHYLLQVHLLNNAITSFSFCNHQKLTDASLTILMTNMQGRILKEKLKDTSGMRQGRSCSIQRMTNLKIVSNLQFLVIHFYSYYMFIHSYKYYIISCTPRNFC